MMLESLKQIGDLYIDDTSILSEQIRKKFKKEPVILEVVFDFDQRKVSYQMRRFQKELVEEYRWIGHTFSATREAIARLTFTNPKYFPSTIVNLIYKLSNSNECKRLVTMLQEIKDDFITENNTLQDDLLSYVRNIKDYEVVFYTICVKKKGELIELAKQTEYTKAIKYMISPESSRTKGFCHVCGEEKDVFTDPAFESGTLLKMYIVDQPGYLSGISTKSEKTSLLRTFSICPDCRYSLIIGEKKVSRDFATNIGNLRVTVIPKIGLLRNSAKEKLTTIFKDFIDISAGLEGISKIDEKLQEGMITDDWYSLSLIFGEREQAKFNYYGTIQEIPLTQITRLRSMMRQISNSALEIWPDDKREQWILTLNQIAGIIPLRMFSGKVQFYPLIELLTALMKNYKYPYRKLVDLAVISSYAHRFGSYEGLTLKSSNQDFSLVHTTLKFNYLILLMQKMGMLTENIPATYEAHIDEDVNKWITQMQYEPWKTALFLMGYLIGKIGNEQYNRGDERKSILDKIDFKGMKWDRIIRLTGDIMNSLRNYRILKYNEGTYHEMCKLIDQSRQIIERNDPSENLFYILTGYSFATYGAIRRGDKT
jgi:CRISPR-associated Csh1 family protein